MYHMYITIDGAESLATGWYINRDLWENSICLEDGHHYTSA